ncbi:cation:proton antiporter [Parahaliea mediterranea]|uniref:Cation:proton antiporter n=1 Tax=Parahaliea mediterranea TaxID=651086 RepID=A0A939IK22_9GAMM|nr:cation:proton antiporter [Parahaliea mediterranea]MBN7798299.1 cation:proton antiporter [Parahaliea mediterranea]
MLDPLIIVIALACGMASRAAGLPALIGYLAAGFLLHELDIGGGGILATLSEIGITLLLFTIGLKLNPRDLLRTHIWGTTVAHMAAMQLFFLGVFYLADALIPGLTIDFTAGLVGAFALTFSSTVFVIQVMQERGEMASRHARLAIGILIIQDLAAVIFLGFSAGKVPGPEALLLLLLLPLRGLILRLLTLSGHGELFTLFGLTLALGGAGLFEATGIKGDLGALIIGAVLAGHQKAKELSRNLLQFKDLFLVCFFLSIGLEGWPQREMILLAAVLGVLALVKPPLYFLLMTRLHTPPRTALLASLPLTNYSEFGLIVVAIAASAGWMDAQWSAAISLAIAISFIIASPLNRMAHVLYRRWHRQLQGFETEVVRAAYPDTRDVRVIVLGMGNIGTGAYEAMAERFGEAVLGVDDNDRKLAQHQRARRRVVAADASDPDFWQRIDLDGVELIMLALTNHEENKLVGKLLGDLGYQGRIAAVVRFSEEAEELESAGISAFNLYAQAGSGFAAHAAAQLGQ